MNDCIFCKIVDGVIPSKKVYEDESVFAFYDIAPHAPIHVLVIPKSHIGSADEINIDNSSIISRIFEVIPKIAKLAGITNGYRIISNCGPDACQTVKHLHFHILGGKTMKEKLI
ncbi:MAG: histidine triad nucleotide-binding protein [Clostridiales bacterium GWF2_38_85]|nr:MAG: histidine triad nucleotide-binding protein [Clostridiales bacterium GWF2_38_85]HBL84063.1 histidine triad nucleotide-binding protein [Clostridiales bacterium]